MITPWIFTFVRPFGRDRDAAYSNSAAQETYDFHLNMLPLLEEVGFEGVFFSEHHFFGNLSPSPNLLLAAAAQRCKKLRLGVMGQVLPLYAPFRIAEEVGMLDLLTHGRLEVGYSSGAGPMEPVAAGIPPNEIRARYAEALDIIELALHQNVFSYSGKYYSYDNLVITPRTIQNLPPRWITVLGEASAADAAKRGCRICTGFLPVATVKAVFDAYREAAASHQQPNGPSQLGIRRQVLVWDNDAEAEAIGKELRILQIQELNAKSAAINRTQAASAESIGPNTAQPKRAGQQATDAHAIDSRASGSQGSASRSTQVSATGVPVAQTINSLPKASRYSNAPHHPQLRDVPDVPANAGVYSNAEECIFGSPHTVAEMIIEQCRATGAGHFLAYTFSGLDASELTHSLQLWRDVIPVLRRANVQMFV